MPKQRKANARRESSTKAPTGRRKLVEFDAETWAALDLLGLDSFMSFQELADEAFRDLLRKHNRPVELRDQLKQSVRAAGRAKSAGPRRA
ncbi:MAG: hypothetical protein ACLPKB_34750 [Xanthobacteraceae bacterium]